MVKTDNINKDFIMSILEKVMDPEIPVISVVDMGMITDVVINNNSVLVKMIPTFTACPALKLMQQNIKDSIVNVGIENVQVELDKEVRWNSDLVSEKGKRLLEDFKLGAPVTHHGQITNEMITESKCPYCGSTNTTINSLFGSTLCRSMHFCYDCKMKFERFKPVA
jgi:ring-1,2-phenylacetyl-CoA epoxidase subunit PaaD